MIHCSKTSEHPADAALLDAEARHRRAVDRVLLRVAHEFEGNCPRPQDSGEDETALAEDGLRQHVLLLRGGVRDRVVRASLLAARHKKKVKLDEKGESENHDSLLGGQGSATSAWSFIQSAPRQS